VAILASSRAALAAAAAPTGTLTLGGGPIRSLDYAHSFDVSTGTVGALASEALLTYDQRLKLVPLVARSWSHPNNRTYVFRMHSGVRFWDGTPLTAEDVAYSIERHTERKLASEMSYYFSSVKGVKVTGSDEVTVFLKTPDPLFEHVQTF